MNKFLTLAGAIFILLGIAALIHPDLKMPAQKTEVQVVGQELEIETRRIITIPAVASGLSIVAGAGLIFLGTRKP